MRVATVDGLVTLFYDGSKELFNQELNDEWFQEYSDHGYNNDNWEEWNLSDECKKYWRDRESWQQVIVVEGVTEIPEYTFSTCKNIKRVIMADTVIRIERSAFGWCSLGYVKLSTNLEYIGTNAFSCCDLTSVFIPAKCKYIKQHAFRGNFDLEIFNVTQQVQLDKNVIAGAKLLEESHFEMYEYDHTDELHNLFKEGDYDDHTEGVHDWLKNINNDEKYSLHRACCSFQPLKQVIMAIIIKQGIGAFNVKNEMGITPSRYLKENPYADVKETDIIQNYVMTMMGEYES